MKTVYLCGAIEGLSKEQAFAWRDIAKRELGGRYIVLDPLDNDDRMTEKEIFEADIKNVEEADIILTEMSHPDKAYIGTSMELWHAYRLGKEIIVWGRANQKNLFLNQVTTERFGMLLTALCYLNGRATEGDRKECEEACK